MYKLCKTEQSAKRQIEIEKCLFDILRVKNFDEITITEICEKMNMPRKAFYRYYDSKEDALHAMIDHTMSEYSGFFVGRRYEKDRSLVKEIREYFSFWQEKKDLLLALDRSGLIAVLVERMTKYPLSDFIDINRFLPDDDERMRESIMRFAISGLVYTMIDWYRDGFKISTDEMARIACRLLRDPLFPTLSQLGIK
jgi:AcrR family transcriptional regulator